MVVIEPSFEIDEKGRVICQSHSKYPQFLRPPMTHLEELQMEKQLTCKSCAHYINDDCYFPRSEIDKIELDRLNRSRFQCNLCGNKIDRMLTIIQKIYFEVKFNMNMPLICCNCYLSLEENKFIENNRRRIIESLSFYTPSIFLIINPFPFNFIATFVFILFVIALKIFIKHRFHYSLFLLDLIKGKRFYEKNFRDQNKLDSP
ncbi:MAG: hypothetical protein HWN80_05070 [Candidatus Lokiarchaeota archaeon]|nr:hypothetical protein [Candidatus Lokiarchaeota archaeon]